jgi:hypothetical protein
VIGGLHKNTLTAALAVVGMSLSSCGHDLVTVNERIFVRKGGSLQYNGGGCMTMQLGGSSSPAPRSPAPPPLEGSDFEVTEGEDANEVVVQVFSDNQLLVTRRYGEATLRSGTVDEFTVATHESSVYVLRYWGGTCAPLDADVELDSGE